MTTSTQRAWEGLANSMRLYVESKLRFNDVFALDREEAVKNQDMAMEAKLEKFHALYDVTKKLPGFDYFGHADTALVIALRNAIHHHEDHKLFQSWNARIHLNDAFRRLSGAEFLLGSTTPEEDVLTVRYYYLLDDFYVRLPALKNVDKHRTLWDSELQFAAIAKTGVDGRYPATQVYVDVMPAFMSAVRRVRSWLALTGFTPGRLRQRSVLRVLRRASAEAKVELQDDAVSLSRAEKLEAALERVLTKHRSKQGSRRPCSKAINRSLALQPRANFSHGFFLANVGRHSQKLWNAGHFPIPARDFQIKLSNRNNCE